MATPTATATNPKIIAIPGLGNISFPGDMSDEDISSAIRRNLADRKRNPFDQFDSPKSNPFDQFDSPTIDPSQVTWDPPIDPSQVTWDDASPRGTKLQEFRAQYPQYEDLSDVQLANALHRKFYKDMPIGEFYQKAGVQFPAEFSPVDGMSSADKFWAGAGKAAMDTGRGIKQLALEAGRAVLPGNAGERVFGDRTDQLRTQSDDIAKRDAALMQTGAGLAGNVAGNFAMIALPGAAAARATKLPGLAAAGRTLLNPTTYRAAAGVGALQGAIQPVGADGNRSTNAALGAAFGAAGNAVANTVGRVAQPVANSLNAMGRRAVDTLDNAGVALDAAQRSGNAVLNRIRSSLTDNPFTAGPQIKTIERQVGQYNRAALRMVGADADLATPEVLAAANQRIGQVFDDVAHRNPIRVDNTLKVGVSDLMSRMSRELDATEARPILNTIEMLRDKSGGTLIDGQLYQNVKTSLDRVASGPNTARGGAARDLRELLDDALERSAQPGDFDALKQARREWWRLDKITRATDENGRINASRLWSTINATKRGRKAAAMGFGERDLTNLARAGKQLLPDKLPNSGTPARLAMQFAPAAAVGIGTQLASDDPSQAFKLAALTYGLPRAMQFGLNNPTTARYLADGLAPGLPRGLLESQGFNALLRQAPTAGLLTYLP